MKLSLFNTVKTVLNSIVTGTLQTLSLLLTHLILWIPKREMNIDHVLIHLFQATL